MFVDKLQPLRVMVVLQSQFIKGNPMSKYHKTAIKHCEKFTARFSHLSDKDSLENFYFCCIDMKTSPTTEINIILQFVNTYNYQINFDNFLSIIKSKRQLVAYNMLNGIHITTITLKTFLCYTLNNTKEAERLYNSYCSNKTAKMRKIMDENPNLAAPNSLENLQIRHGNEIGLEKYNEYCNSKRITSKRCIEYWIDLGFSYDEAKIHLSDHQKLFSKEICIQKHGEIKGLKIWSDRQTKWQETLNSKPIEEIKSINKRKGITLQNMITKYGEQEGTIRYDAWYQTLVNRVTSSPNKSYYSKESITFFESHFKHYLDEENILWKDDELSLFNDHRIYFYDLTFIKEKVIVEYHGEAYHPNYSILSVDQISKWIQLVTCLSAEVVKANDDLKRSIAELNGYTIFEVYSNDSEETINEKVSLILDMLVGSS